MPSSRAHVVSPDADEYATALVAQLASRTPATLDGDTTLLLLAGGQLRVRPGRGAMHLEASADDDTHLAQVEDAVSGHLLALAGRGGLGVEWWRQDGTLRRAAVAGAALGEPGPVVRWLLRQPARLYRADLGWLLGHRFLLLTHAGRRTGKPHPTVLEVLRYDPVTRAAVVLSGRGRAADWYLNLQHARPLKVAIGRERFVPVHRELDADEAADVLAEFEQRNSRASLVVRIALSRMVGWRYHGTPAHRRRLVKQLPLIELRPEASSRPAVEAATPQTG